MTTKNITPIEPEHLDGEALTLQYVPISIALLWDDNPKLHDIGAIITSINEYGFRDPPTWDATLGGIVEGNGRTEALSKMQDSGYKKPRGILTHKDTGEWCMPILFGIDADSISAARKYAIDHNNLVLAGSEFSAIDVARLWDRDGYKNVLQKIVDDGEHPVSVDFEDFATLKDVLFDDESDIANREEKEKQISIDRAEELLEKWQVKLGQVWEIKSPKGMTHRLMCGDSTDASNVGLLINGLDISLMVTDPPYGVEYNQDWRSDNRTGKVTNDDRASWLETWQNSPADVAYVWHASRHATTVSDDLEAAGFEHRAQIIWNKPRHVFSQGHYHWKHEPCFYAVRKGKTAQWAGDRKQNTVWDIEPDEDAPGNHGTQKPVECMARPIQNHEGNVYDPFGGSGTTMVAAERHRRHCRMMEIEPKYCSIVLERMEILGCTMEVVHG